MGVMASMLWWPDALCERLAGAGRFVIRYDNRDTGRSTGYEPGTATYTLDDMAGDAVAVLDAHGLERAHVVGMSMGGAIAQVVALAHPERVASVTTISTTAVGAENPDLPGPTAEYMEHAAAFDDLDWSDTRAVAELLVRDSRALAGTRHPFDEAAARERVTRDLEQASGCRPCNTSTPTCACATSTPRCASTRRSATSAAAGSSSRGPRTSTSGCPAMATRSSSP